MSSDDPAPKRPRLENDLMELRASERRMQRELGQRRRTEGQLILKLALKENELRDVKKDFQDMANVATDPFRQQEYELFCDPMVNLEIEKLREEVKEANRKEKEAQDQLQASQFQSGSIAGKKLIQKCKELQAENDQLGKELSEGKMQKLKADMLLQKSYEAELHKCLKETREFVEYLGDELDTSQAIVFSQRREIANLKKQLEEKE